MWAGSNVEKAAGLGILFKNPHIEVKSVSDIIPGRLLAVDIKYQCLILFTLYTVLQENYLLVIVI